MAVVIQIENLVKRYKELVALDHLNLEVEEGEIFGLLGPNGSGKSTTINCILALLKYDKGTVKVFGREMKPDSYDIKKDTSFIFFITHSLSGLNTTYHVVLCPYHTLRIT